MYGLSNIQEVEENLESTNGDLVGDSILAETNPYDKSNSSTLTTDSNHTNSDSRTKGPKSIASLQISVDQTILQLVNQMEDYDSLRSRSTFLCDCCDLVRTCLVVDILYVILIPAFLAFHTIRYTAVKSAGVEDFADDRLFFDDDGFAGESAKSDVKEHYSLEFLILIIKNILEIIFPVFGIYGVCKFNKPIILSVAIWFVVDFIVSAILMRWTVVVIVAFVSAIHFALFRMIRKGEISSRQYPNESVCCCGRDDDDDSDIEE